MNNNENVTIKIKTSINDLDLFDLPMVGLFKYKEYAAYTLSILAGIDVTNLDDMEVTVEDFMSNMDYGKRDMRMDVRINIRNGEQRVNIEIQRIKKDDIDARALFYGGGLATDFAKGLKAIPKTVNIVIFICDFDPFEGTQYAGQTRMMFKLKSEDDENKFHTLNDRPYPFDGLTLIFYNGVQDWEKNPPKSEEEEKIRVYLSDMKNTDPEKMTSEIARKTCKVYKEDPRVMDNVAEWIRFKYGDQMDMELEAQKKKLEKVHKEELDAQKKEYEEKLHAQKLEIAEKLHAQKLETAEKLLALGAMTISEIAETSDLDVSEVEAIANRKKD